MVNALIYGTQAPFQIIPYYVIYKHLENISSQVLEQFGYQEIKKKKKIVMLEMECNDVKT